MDINSLKKTVFVGAISKGLEMTDLVLDQLNYELSVIENLDIVEYFIIYSRIIEICNNEGLLRSYGRGSACSSLVNYCLDITKINPLEEGLIFERFLNPSISRMADIDIDVPMGSQKLIVEKLKSELPEYFINFIAYHPSLQSNSYKRILIGDIEFRKHPCAVIISSENLQLPKGNFEDETYYVLDDFPNQSKLIESFKFDILELEYLNKLDLVSQQVGLKYHPYKLNLTDEKTFELYASGDMTNIFQLDYSSCKKRMVDFRPSSINDLAVFHTIFRPGIVANITELIYNKKNGLDEFYESDTRVYSILKETYGLLIYQESFLHLAHDIAGFSYSEADLYRRILCRPNDKNKVDEFKKKFTKGCKMNSSLNGKDFNQLMNTILQFLPISFNKSHSLCYSMIGYWGAYYKTHFKSEFETVFNTSN